MPKLKQITKAAVPKALKRAERYRLINQPSDAESICLDILDVDPSNDEARSLLLLARTDQFDERLTDAYTDAREVLDTFEDEYERIYYDGVICERRAKAHMKRAFPGSNHVAYDWFTKAMDLYVEAEKKRPKGQDESVLRYNSCVRILERHPELKPREDSDGEQMLE